MTDDDAAAFLAIADRLERFSFQSSRDPERPFVERGEFVRAIREQVHRARRRVPAESRGEITVGLRIVGGREIAVELRRELTVPAISRR